MYIAMNRFRIREGREPDFERAWRERNSYLHEVPGFQKFHLLRGAAKEGATTYVSHSPWDSEQAFVNWTESDAFRKAHQNARSPEGTLIGPPQFEGFQVVLEK